jgi:hypothetical protein
VEHHPAQRGAVAAQPWAALGLSVGPLTTLLLFLLITPAVLPTGGAFAISTLLVSWVAVAWHRYVLQEKDPAASFLRSTNARRSGT